MIRHSSTPGLTAVLVAFAILLAACSDDADGQATSPPSTSEPAPTGAGSATNAAPEADYLIVGATYLTGPGRWALTATGDPEAPMAVFDVPAGFDAREVNIWTDRRGWGQLTYWAPTRVLADPCDVDDASLPLGPTVEDLAAALAAQQRTTTTEPVPVELDGHRGLYLELRTPTNLDDPACESEVLIWEAGESGDGRFLNLDEVQGTWTDRYWILDVGGRRVVVTALTPSGAKSDDLVTGVAETTTFVQAADSSAQ